ncbi:ABC transporter ATP-binding protein [Pseudomonas chlororaphis]|uniref:ABC transporter ATP-binding protein n=1 Tax=Pseudomonas chlororaphis TaxID=587753 RepID=UPI0009BEA5EF|nr:ABC transporter ATP-binding protein [Pseudomonas chlororaphis]AZD03676.1 O-antigen export system, ATP-binding protein [Pseudomonas chlororaphis subsp. chlororaphis]MBM0285295.1 ABC transporter ATP-binding protein [Pseudomonas chlororaphis]MDO1503485.1 ABC transporter ATP-binding protein [Pseudomonas chlororaphis]ORM46934.1 sugar ABC transporter ATP-binding protein [Pseudomonas chlororaphis subsp. chlororaphis]TWR96879.1 ABC transporter ATP-binding protein [Pseudomonas chlororaphis subsp. ch
MSSDFAIKATNLSKCYEIYENPRDRLKQFVIPRIPGNTDRKFYKEFWALRDLSFEVKRGESVGILGRNGSGKSTLLQMITGTLSPSSGTVETHGRIAALLELGSGFNPEFSGRDNVYMNGALLGLTRDQINDRFDSIAAFADIGDFIDHPVKTYSSGMLVRLAFAVQVQVEPDILIVDEALAVGDALFQKRCFQRIEKLLNDGVTLLFVSHDIESVRTLTQNAIFLKNGVVVTQGSSPEVIREYRRHLHEEEMDYFSSIIQKVSESAAQPSILELDTPEVIHNDLTEQCSERSSALSFGEGEVKVITVKLFDSEGNPRSIFSPGEPIRVRVSCESQIEISNLNVAVRIRNKEGVKIYSWGTLNQDMRKIATENKTKLFWDREFSVGEEFSVDFDFDCALGTNLYEVQAAVSYEETPDYHGQRILHWVDEAAFFQCVVNREQNFFGGVVNLDMRAKW